MMEEYVHDVHGTFLVSEVAVTPCHNRNILFGQGHLDGRPASYFLPLTSDALEVLEQWNEGCKVPVTECSFRIVGFFNRGDVKVLVTGTVTMTITEMVSGLNNPSVGIEGIEFMRVWNQYSCSLYKAKYYDLFCEAEDIMVGENHEIVIPFTSFETNNKNKFSWFDAVYEKEMVSMRSMYLNHNPYKRSSKTLEILFTSIRKDKEVMHYFRTQTIPVFYDVESFDAYLVRNLDSVQTHWKKNPKLQHQMDYGNWIRTELPTQFDWENDILNGLHGPEWRAELISWNDLRSATNSFPLKASDDHPKNRRNCPMVFIIFARNRLTHGVTGAYLSTLSKAELLRELDKIIPGAIMQFFVEAIKRRSNRLLMTRGW